MNKVSFAFTAIAILLAASILPSVGSENVSPVISNEKTIEVPVKIYTLHGVKEIKKELPVEEVAKLMYMTNETRGAMKLLFNEKASFMERMKANGIIDSFLYELKKKELLGNMTIKEVKDLIMGEYLQKQENDIEARKIMLIPKLLSQNDWEVNALCYLFAQGFVYDFYPWNFIPMLSLYLAFHYGPIPWWLGIFIPFIFLDFIPHPTTIGYWIVEPSGFYEKRGGVDTYGLLGKKEINLGSEEKAAVFTIGFIGLVLGFGTYRFGVGFTLFTAFKKT